MATTFPESLPSVAAQAPLGVHGTILAPVIALVLWTFVMWLWL